MPDDNSSYTSMKYHELGFREVKPEPSRPSTPDNNGGVWSARVLDVPVPWRDRPEIIKVDWGPPVLPPEPRPDHRPHFEYPGLYDRYNFPRDMSRPEMSHIHNVFDPLVDHAANEAARNARDAAQRAAADAFARARAQGLSEADARTAARAAMHAAVIDCHNTSLRNLDDLLSDLARKELSRSPEKRAQGRRAGLWSTVPAIGWVLTALTSRNMSWEAKFTAGKTTAITGGVAAFSGPLFAAYALLTGIAPPVALAVAASLFAVGFINALAGGSIMSNAVTMSAVTPSTNSPSPQPPIAPTSPSSTNGFDPVRVRSLLSSKPAADNDTVTWLQDARAAGIVTYSPAVARVLDALARGEGVADAERPSGSRHDIPALDVLHALLDSRARDTLENPDRYPEPVHVTSVIRERQRRNSSGTTTPDSHTQGRAFDLSPDLSNADDVIDLLRRLPTLPERNYYAIGLPWNDERTAGFFDRDLDASKIDLEKRKSAALRAGQSSFNVLRDGTGKVVTYTYDPGKQEWKAVDHPGTALKHVTDPELRSHLTEGASARGLRYSVFPDRGSGPHLHIAVHDR